MQTNTHGVSMCFYVFVCVSVFLLDHGLGSSWNDIVTQIHLLVSDPAAAFGCGRKHPNRLLEKWLWPNQPSGEKQ